MGRYAAVSASPAPLTADDLAALAFVNEAVIAPAGDRVAYAVRRVDLQADRYRAALFVSSVDGSGATRWTDGTAEDDQQICLIRQIASYTVNAGVEIGDLVSTTLQDRGEGAQILEMNVPDDYGGFHGSFPVQAWK